MGYFVNYTLEDGDPYEDYSYPSPDRQLMWRLEDLHHRWEELNEPGVPHPKYDEGLRLTDDAIRYAIPEYFKSLREVERAIDLTISDLRSKYDLVVKEDSAGNAQPLDVPLVGQLCLDGLNFAETPNPPLKAA